MGFLDRWRGTSISLTDGGFWKAFFGLGTHSGEVVSVESTLQLDAAWACAKLVAETVGTLPCMVYETDGATVASEHPLYELLHDQPNIDNTAVEFWEAITLSLQFYGNAFAEKTINAGRITALRIIHPSKVTISRERGERVYTVAENSSQRKLKEDQVFHVRGFGFGDDVGLSTIAFARQTVGSAIAAEKTAGKMFANGMQPSGILTSDKVLTADQRAQLGKMLEQYAGSDRAGKVAVFEAGLTYQQLMFTPEDAQMLATRRFGVEQVCRWFGVPPIMVGHAAEGVTTWGSGVEQIILQFTKTGLRPILKRIEAAIRRDLLTKEDRKKIKVEFNLEGLLRGDTQARAAFYSTMVQNGIFTRNYCRKLENLPPIAGGDELTAQTNLAPLGQLGAVAGSMDPAFQALVKGAVEQALAARKDAA